MLNNNQRHGNFSYGYPKITASAEVAGNRKHKVVKG
jgi:hypothetical protein